MPRFAPATNSVYTGMLALICLAMAIGISVLALEATEYDWEQKPKATPTVKLPESGTKSGPAAAAASSKLEDVAPVAAPAPAIAAAPVATPATAPAAKPADAVATAPAPAPASAPSPLAGPTPSPLATLPLAGPNRIAPPVAPVPAPPAPAAPTGPIPSPLIGQFGR